MTGFVVVARRAGDSVTFVVEAENIKAAYAKAKAEARDVFDYKPGELAPVVSVKPLKEEE